MSNSSVLSIKNKIRLEHSENFLEELETIEASIPGCSELCLFRSPNFLQYLDSVGLETPPRTNFSSEFLAQHPELISSLPPIRDVLPLDELEREQCASLIYSRISPGQTRLLCLKAGSWQDNLQCTLEPYTVSNATSYCALSYTWGKPIFESRIICNGVDLAVTQNLSDALRNLRYEHVDRLLWVDALCINQVDLDEVGVVDETLR